MRLALAILVTLAVCARGQVQCTTNSHISFPDADVYSPTNITVSCWVYDGPLNAAFQAYFSKLLNDPGNIEWALIRPNATNLRYDVSNDGLTSGRIYVWLREPLPQGRWCHVALTAGQGKANIYIDGSLKVSSNFVGGIVNKNEPVRISAVSFDSGFFNQDSSRYADFRLYGRVLSASEIAEIYARPWSLADDPSIVLRTCIVTDDTGTALTGTAKNYGSGADGTYSNSPTAAPWTRQFTKPRRETIP